MGIQNQGRPSSKDAHLVALITYALHLTGSEKKETAFRELERLKNFEASPYEMAFWTRAGNEIPQLTKSVVANYPNQVWFPMADSNFDSYTIAASSIAMMTYMYRDDIPSARKVMRFLQSRRPAIFGWRSTRGTLLALNSLRQLALYEQKRKSYDLQVSFNMSLTPPVRHTFDKLYKSTIPEMQSVEVPHAWGQLEVHASGIGYALIGIVHQMSVEHEYQYLDWAPPLTQSEETMPFDLKWQINYSGKNMSHMHFSVKLRWKMDHIATRSNMAVLKVNLPSGYSNWDDRFVQYGYYGPVPNLMRAKCKYGSAYFYFKYLDRTWTEVKFTVFRWYPVANMTQWHAISVYDYYEPMITTMKVYSVIGLKNLDICKVFGSFQCPYSYYYNSGNRKYNFCQFFYTMFFNMLFVVVLFKMII